MNIKDEIKQDEEKLGTWAKEQEAKYGAELKAEGVDILDRVPMVPGGPWINHPVWGTLGIAIIGIIASFWIPHKLAFEIAILFMTALVSFKKWFDYTTRGPAAGETLVVCIGRVVVTVLPASLIFLAYYRFY
jgi:hypothetical protein